MPTKILAEAEYRKNLQNCSSVVTIIHSDTDPGFAVKRIIDHIIGPQPEGQVLVITQTALERLPPFKRDRWILFIDEIPQVHNLFEANLRRRHVDVTAHLELGEEYYGYRELEIADRAALKQLADDMRLDQGYSNEMTDIVQKLLSPHWKSYVNPIAYQELLDNNSPKFIINSVLNPSMIDGFESVYVAGAHFKNSLFYLTWKSLGVQFAVEDASGLRFTTHNGAGTTIYYLSKRKWSKTLGSVGGKNSVLKRIVSFIQTHVADSAFIYSQNKGDPLFAEDSNHQMIPYLPHGLNNYTQFNTVILLAARNPKPAQSGFMEKTLNIVYEQISQGIHMETVYQNALRSSLRDPTNLNQKIIYLPDFDTAEWLAEELPGAKLEFLESGILELAGKPPKKTVAQTDAQRAKKYRDKKRQLDESKPYEGPHAKGKDSGINFDGQISESSTLYGGNVTEFRASIFIDEYAPYPCHLIENCSVEDFEYCLEHWFEERRVKTKEENALMSLSLFDPNAGKKNRGMDNVMFANGIMLDFDGGDFGPNELAILYHEFRMTTYSTFTATMKEKKFRAFIPTSKPVILDEYRKVASALQKRLTASEFVFHVGAKKGEKTHKLDDSKLSAENLFYLPCSRIDPPADHFRHFAVLSGEGRSILDPKKIINECNQAIRRECDDMEDEAEENKVVRGEEFKRKGIEMALNDWYSVRGRKGEGNRNFNRLGFQLANAGCQEYEIRMILEQQAGTANSPTQRRKEINRILSDVTSPKVLRKIAHSNS